MRDRDALRALAKEALGVDKRNGYSRILARAVLAALEIERLEVKDYDDLLKTMDGEDAEAYIDSTGGFNAAIDEVHAAMLEAMNQG